MADGYVGVAPDGIGKKVDTAEISVNGVLVERQRVVIGDNTQAGNFAYVMNTVPPDNAIALAVREARSLVERMGARAPQQGYHLWLDVTSSNASYIYVCEAPDGSTATGTNNVWQGIRIQLDSSGNPLGAVQTATGFDWNNRATASWSS